jgi:hypothetical protein
MDISRREVLGLVAVSAVAGCSGGDSGEGDADSDTDDTQTTNGLPGTTRDGTAGTSPAGSCESNFGDTLQRYEPDIDGTIATFGYPMGGTVTTEQSISVGYVIGLGYGRGDISPLHTMTVSQRGPSNDTGDATEAYSFSDEYVEGTVTTYGGQERPASIRRTDESVTYIVRVDGPDGFYEFSVQTSAGEGEPCPAVYESISRRVIESFEPIA